MKKILIVSLAVLVLIVAVLVLRNKCWVTRPPASQGAEGVIDEFLKAAGGIDEYVKLKEEGKIKIPALLRKEVENKNDEQGNLKYRNTVYFRGNTELLKVNESFENDETKWVTSRVLINGKMVCLVFYTISPKGTEFSCLDEQVPSVNISFVDEDGDNIIDKVLIRIKEEFYDAFYYENNRLRPLSDEDYCDTLATIKLMEPAWQSFRDSLDTWKWKK